MKWKSVICDAALTPIIEKIKPLDSICREAIIYVAVELSQDFAFFEQGGKGGALEALHQLILGF